MSRNRDENAINITSDEWEQLPSDCDRRKAAIDGRRHVLDRCRSLLTDKQYYVLEHTLWLGETQIEVAEQMGISQPTVAQYLAAAKKKLRLQLRAIL